MNKRVNNAFFMRPWAIKKDIFDVMNEVFHRFNRGEKLSAEEIQAAVGDKKKTSPDFEIIGDTAFVPIYGIIAKRSSMINGISQPQGTSIEEIRKDFMHALGNSNVKNIVLDIDSPGGSVDGVAEMAEMIFNARGKKPIYAYADGMMASAAYWIGSAADKVFASKSSEVGSIGVYATVYDWSVANHNAGIKTHIIKAGKNKAAGHPDQQLSEDDRAVIQEEINDIYELFTEAVSRHRNISAAQSMEAATGRVYIASKAKKLGLIDGIQSIDVERERASQASGNQATAAAQPEGAAGVSIDQHKKEGKIQTQEEVDMDLKGLTLESLKASRPDLYDAIHAEGKAAGSVEQKKVESDSREAGRAEGKTTGVNEERTRVLSIMDSAKAIPGCEAQAEAAIKDGTSADDALKGFKDSRLKSIKKEAPAAPGASGDAIIDADAGLSIEERCKKDWETKPQVRKDFATLESYTGYTRAQSKGRVKIAGANK